MRLHARGRPASVDHTIIGRITSRPIDEPDRHDYIAHLVAGGTLNDADLAGYAGILAHDDSVTVSGNAPIVRGAEELTYLSDGDVVLLSPSGHVNVLYRKTSRHNTFLATERCNSLCLMCSQPPKPDDDSHRVAEILRALELIDTDCRELGLSGGEPTLLGDDFLRIVETAKRLLPRTALHVLTNGRRFKDRNYSQALGRIGHPDVMLGIPVYSDIDVEHDHVVQAVGAFDETLLGLYELAAARVPVEIRVVVHALTWRRLPQLADFIGRNLPFAHHVAVMGLEMFGYVHLNMETVWIDPADYAAELEAAVVSLARRGMNVSIYNHQLCTIPQSIWPFSRKSISDWKNIYLDECNGCGVQEMCGGFFQSATKKHSAHIRPLPILSTSAAARLRQYVGT